MTDLQLQLYIPSLATLLLVGIGILNNNARVSDLNTNLNKRIDDLRADCFARMEKIDQQYARLESVLVGKIDEIDERLGNIESRLDMR